MLVLFITFSVCTLISVVYGDIYSFLILSVLPQFYFTINFFPFTMYIPFGRLRVSVAFIFCPLRL